MPSPIEIGLGIFLPAVLCGLLLAFARPKGSGGHAALCGIAFGAPWLVSFYVFYGRSPAWPSPERTLTASDWLAWLVLLAAVSCLLYLAAIPARFLAAVLRVGLSAALVYLTLARWAERKGSWAALVACFLAFAVVWTLTDAWVARARAPRAPIALAVAAIAASLASLLGRNAVLGEVVGALSACLVAAAFVPVLRPGFRLPASAVAIVFLVLGGSLMQGCAFSRLPWTSAGLVAAALLAPGLLELRRASDTESWKRTLLAVLLALVPAALAVWTAWIPDESGY
ncbi:MAG: hypothetical protein ACKVXR_14500 [Planctomycetota bacterium]